MRVGGRIVLAAAIAGQWFALPACMRAPGAASPPPIDMALPLACSLFDRPREMTIVEYDVGPAVADLNGDGRSDLAFAAVANGLGVMLGQADRALSVEFLSGSGHTSGVPAIADFDGDGRLDAALLDDLDGTVKPHLQGAGGIFTTATPIPVDSNPWRIAAGDLDRDGHPDLVVGYVGVLVGDTGASPVTVLLGDGTGSFPRQRPTTLAAESDAMVLDDFDGDGVLDLAVATFAAGTVNLLRGDGAGGFGDPTAAITFPPIMTYPGEMVSADFDRDGRRDLALLEKTTLAVHLGRGDGSFVAGDRHESAGTLLHLAAADVDGDGAMDLASSDGASASVQVLLGRGDGTFQAVTPSCSLGGVALSLAAGDFDGDGAVDLVAAVGNQHLEVLYRAP